MYYAYHLFVKSVQPSNGNMDDVSLRDGGITGRPGY